MVTRGQARQRRDERTARVRLPVSRGAGTRERGRRKPNKNARGGARLPPHIRRNHKQTVLGNIPSRTPFSRTLGLCALRVMQRGVVVRVEGRGPTRHLGLASPRRGVELLAVEC